MSLSDQQWCPTSVQVTVHQARGLRIKGKSGTNDAYAVMQVGKEKYQTTVVEKSVAPVWKEEAAFDLQPGGTDRGTLHVHVLHRALVGPDKLLGQAVINLLQLSEDKTRNKTEWFKLLDKTGKADKDRGEVLVDIQFMRNNMTASMFDLSAAGKSKSRLGKFKDKVRGKKKESDAASTTVQSFTQVLTDSEEEGNGDGEAAVSKDEKKKKHKMKSLFSPKSNLQKNMSQSMSVLPAKNSSLSGSQTSGLNVDAPEGKKKFKFMKHKRSGSSESKDPGHQKHVAAEQSNLCINGSHIYCEEPPPRTSRIGSNFSLTSSGHGSMEDVPESSPPSVDSLKAVRQYSPWTEEEEEEETAAAENIKEEEGELRREEEERVRMEEEERRRKEEEEERVRRREEELEKRKQEEEERRRIEEEKVKREEEERMRREEEQRRRQEEEERVRREEEERQRLAEEKRRLEEMRQREEEERIRREEEERAQEERKRREEEERRRIEEDKVRKEEEERVRREEEERQRLAEEKRRLEEQERRRIEEEIKRQKEEEERIRMEEERDREERRRREEEEKRRLAEEEKRIEEAKVRKEEEERIRRAEVERRRREEEEMVRRQEEEREEKRRLEEQERKRREEEERIKKEEEEKARREKEEYERLVEEKRKLAEEERKRVEAERKRREEEEERARKEKEEIERLAEEKRILEEQERKKEEEKRKKEEEERIKKEEDEARRQEEEERVRKEKEEMERLAKEKRILEEQERKKEEEKRKREEEERIQKEEEVRRQEEEERVRKEKEEYERLVEEKRRQEEQERRRLEEEERIRMEEEERARKEKEEMERRRLEEQERRRRIEEEERIRREENAEKERKEEEARRMEKEKLSREAEEQKKRENQTKHKTVEKKSKVAVESPAEVTSTNPFDEDFSYNPFEEAPNSPESSTARASAVQQGCQSAVSPVGGKISSTCEKDLTGSQREKRLAPQPPGKNQAERESQREQDGSTRHVTQMNKQSKDKEAKTASVLPLRSVQTIAPLSSSPTDTKNTQSLMQSGATKGATNVAKHSKRPAPSRPRSVEEGPPSEPKTAHSSNGNISRDCASKAKQEPTVYGLNPFEDDEENEPAAQDEKTTSGNSGSIQQPPAASQAVEKDAASQTKIKSSKMARAPPLPAKKADTLGSSTNQNTEGAHVTDDTGVTVPDNSACDQAVSPVSVQENPLQESQHAAVQSSGEDAAGKKEGPPPAPRRLQPVKPLNPVEQQSVPVVQGQKDNKSTEILGEVQEKTKVNGTGVKGPYSQLTQQELISLVLQQENQLSARDKKIAELELYIDNLLVRVMEEKPSILMSMNSLKKPV